MYYEGRLVFCSSPEHRVIKKESPDLGTPVKFIPIKNDSLVLRNGCMQPVSCRYQSITLMKEFLSKSFEEIRLEHYISNKKEPDQVYVFGSNKAESNLFNFEDFLEKNPFSTLNIKPISGSSGLEFGCGPDFVINFTLVFRPDIITLEFDNKSASSSAFRGTGSFKSYSQDLNKKSGPLFGIGKNSSISPRFGLGAGGSAITNFETGTNFRDLGTPIKFKPNVGTDCMVKNGILSSIKVRYQCITLMNVYKSESFEELRLEDYFVKRKEEPKQVNLSSDTKANTNLFKFGASDLKINSLELHIYPGFEFSVTLSFESNFTRVCLSNYSAWGVGEKSSDFAFVNTDKPSFKCDKKPHSDFKFATTLSSGCFGGPTFGVKENSKASDFKMNNIDSLYGSPTKNSLPTTESSQKESNSAKPLFSFSLPTPITTTPSGLFSFTASPTTTTVTKSFSGRDKLPMKNCLDKLSLHDVVTTASSHLLPGSGVYSFSSSFKPASSVSSTATTTTTSSTGCIFSTSESKEKFHFDDKKVPEFNFSKPLFFENNFFSFEEKCGKSNPFTKDKRDLDWTSKSFEEVMVYEQKRSSGDENSNLDIFQLDTVEIDELAVDNKVKKIKYLLKNGFEKNCEIAWLLRAITCIDLTSLSGDDTDSNVKRLCYKAAHPVSSNLINQFKEELDFDDIEKIRTAAVCVYPTRVSAVANEIKKFKLSGKIGVASVATGFPSGQYPLESKLLEIENCVISGATEIDIVIRRELVICGKWKKLFDEIKQMKDVCGDKVCLKTILSTGECGSLKNVYKASLVAMLAGSNFIKTSTGKESVNATLQVGLVMCRAINQYYEKTGRKVGLKPAGGIRTSNDALLWLVMVKEILGNDWLNSKLFRIGASGLLGDIEKRLFYLINGYQPPANSFFIS